MLSWSIFRMSPDLTLPFDDSNALTARRWCEANTNELSKTSKRDCLDGAISGFGRPAPSTGLSQENGRYPGDEGDQQQTEEQPTEINPDATHPGIRRDAADK